MIIGLGIDIVKVSRITESHKRYAIRFLNRVFDRCEIEYCMVKADPYPALAARFAVKEAYIKALHLSGVMGLSYTDIFLSGNQFGKKTLITKGRILGIDQDLGVVRRHFSIAHENEYAVATVVLECIN